MGIFHEASGLVERAYSVGEEVVQLGNCNAGSFVAKAARLWLTGRSFHRGRKIKWNDPTHLGGP